MKRLVLEVAVLVALSAAAGTLTYHFHPRAPSLYLYQEPAATDEITVRAARDLEAHGGVLWIDARVRSEFEKDHIPGAWLLNQYEWDDLMFKMVETLTANTKPVIVYCDAQQCDQARLIADKLRDLGNTDIRVLKGGWQAWKNLPGR